MKVISWNVRGFNKCDIRRVISSLIHMEDMLNWMQVEQGGGGEIVATGMERQEVWEEVGSVSGLFSRPWVLAGDFNVVRYPSEKSNCNRSTRAMLEILSSLMIWS
ncbi:hypothetical protein H5410_061651 [Solanum commersonii]|uniref:Exo_endo_phos domain-containing protein n=1 Tax=Solanum commersonii TaxID=4109 RepID=A0A9J5W8G5_SOLCO|nr:hypothetical protein H5410_061651 [Solanum commersonii]